MVFDAAGFYGHNECKKHFQKLKASATYPIQYTEICLAVDVKAMRISRYQFGRTYMNAYRSHIPISPPEEDVEARLALYSLRRY